MAVVHRRRLHPPEIERCADLLLAGVMSCAEARSACGAVSSQDGRVRYLFSSDRRYSPGDVPVASSSSGAAESQPGGYTYAVDWHTGRIIAEVGDPEADGYIDYANRASASFQERCVTLGAGGIPIPPTLRRALAGHAPVYSRLRRAGAVAITVAEDQKRAAGQEHEPEHDPGAPAMDEGEDDADPERAHEAERRREQELQERRRAAEARAKTLSVHFLIACGLGKNVYVDLAEAKVQAGDVAKHGEYFEKIIENLVVRENVPSETGDERPYAPADLEGLCGDVGEGETVSWVPVAAKKCVRLMFANPASEVLDAVCKYAHVDDYELYMRGAETDFVRGNHFDAVGEARVADGVEGPFTETYSLLVDVNDLKWPSRRSSDRDKALSDGLASGRVHRARAARWAGAGAGAMVSAIALPRSPRTYVLKRKSDDIERNVRSGDLGRALIKRRRSDETRSEDLVAAARNRLLTESAPQRRYARTLNFCLKKERNYEELARLLREEIVDRDCMRWVGSLN